MPLLAHGSNISDLHPLSPLAKSVGASTSRVDEQTCDTLQKLRMDWCPKITDSSVNYVLSKCRNLLALDIGCCEEVTDAALEGLPPLNDDMPLKVLKVSNCPKITVSGVSKLLDSCKYLEYLDVRSSPHVTEAGCIEAGLKFGESCTVNFTGSLTVTENELLI